MDDLDFSNVFLLSKAGIHEISAFRATSISTYMSPDHSVHYFRLSTELFDSKDFCLECDAVLKFNGVSLAQAFAEDICTRSTFNHSTIGINDHIV